MAVGLDEGGGFGRQKIEISRLLHEKRPWIPKGDTFYLEFMLRSRVANELLVLYRVVGLSKAWSDQAL